jgi:hypothetical protein
MAGASWRDAIPAISGGKDVAKVVNLGAASIENRALNCVGAVRRLEVAIDEVNAALAHLTHCTSAFSDAVNSSQFGVECIPEGITDSLLLDMIVARRGRAK